MKSADITAIAVCVMLVLMVGSKISDAWVTGLSQKSKLRRLNFDGHQYLSYQKGYMDGICHLESCTNSVHLK